jgi:hypothetical protein
MPRAVPAGSTYRLQYVNCGKGKCKTCRGTSYAHGPYWYAFKHGADGVRSYYVGKQREATAGADWKESKRGTEAPRPRAGGAGDPWSVLGVARGASQDEIRRAYRAAARKHHPDVGGSTARMQEINRAWDSLRGRRR